MVIVFAAVVVSAAVVSVVVVSVVVVSVVAVSAVAVSVAAVSVFAAQAAMAKTVSRTIKRANSFFIGLYNLLLFLSAGRPNFIFSNYWNANISEAFFGPGATGNAKEAEDERVWS